MIGGVKVRDVLMIPQKLVVYIRDRNQRHVEEVWCCIKLLPRSFIWFFLLYAWCVWHCWYLCWNWRGQNETWLFIITKCSWKLFRLWSGEDVIPECVRNLFLCLSIPNFNPTLITLVVLDEASIWRSTSDFANNLCNDKVLFARVAIAFRIASHNFMEILIPVMARCCASPSPTYDIELMWRVGFTKPNAATICCWAVAVFTSRRSCSDVHRLSNFVFDCFWEHCVGCTKGRSTEFCGNQENDETKWDQFLRTSQTQR